MLREGFVLKSCFLLLSFSRSLFVLKSFALEKQSRKCHVFKEFPAYKELPGKLNDDVIVDANVCVQHQLNGNLKHRRAKDPRVFALSVCRECACLEKKGINGNTTCPHYADINKKDICTVMSYLQNGPKRPTSESFDVACKVGSKS